MRFPDQFSGTVYEKFGYNHIICQKLPKSKEFEFTP